MNYPLISAMDSRAAVESIMEMVPPFRYGGRNPVEGFDCLGLVLYYLVSRGYAALPDPLSVEPDCVRGSLFADQFVPAPIPYQVDDVVELDNNEGGRHLGVMVQGGVFHMTNRVGPIVTPLNRLKILGVYRLKCSL